MNAFLWFWVPMILFFGIDSSCKLIRIEDIRSIEL